MSREGEGEGQGEGQGQGKVTEQQLELGKWLQGMNELEPNVLF